VCGCGCDYILCIDITPYMLHFWRTRMALGKDSTGREPRGEVAGGVGAKWAGDGYILLWRRWNVEVEVQLRGTMIDVGSFLFPTYIPIPM
jgi:hypothetical protein